MVDYTIGPKRRFSGWSSTGVSVDARAVQIAESARSRHRGPEMISIKRYWNANADAGGELMKVVLSAYRSGLRAFGLSAAQACPPAAQPLQKALDTLGQELTEEVTLEAVVSTEARVSQVLEAWGQQAQENLEKKTNDVRELLVVMANTAATFAASDVRYARRFDEFTARLQRIANLDDLAELRSTIVRTAAELKTHVEQMSQSTRRSVAQLQAEVATYQTRLEEAEQLAARDELTGLFKRSKIEAHIEHRIAAGRPFSVVMVDLNGFKQVNDNYGHKAGDDLLKQFSADLRSNMRPGDLIGRWGGDEFIVVLDCGRSEAGTQLDRIEQWVLGDYSVEGLTGRQKVKVEASMGIAEWASGCTMRGLIDQADAAMYAKKPARRAS